jgi:hypothetical protein
MLRFALSAEAPEKGWSKADIARKCELGVHGGADEHIAGLLALGLLIERRGRYWPISPASTLGERLSELVVELEAIPECRIDELLVGGGAR